MPFPESLAQRGAYILDQVRLGLYEIPWLPITSVYNGHAARFWVSGDAMKVDGVRVNVTAMLQQQIADIIGAMLPTPRIVDLIYMEADIVLQPMPMPITSSTVAMVDQSRKIDAAVVKVVGSIDAAKGRIVSTVGKTWVVANGLLTHPGMAENYGWHFRGATFGGKAWEVNASLAKDPVTGQYLRLIQGEGWFHSSSHTDYSQNALFVLTKAELDGATVDINSILSDPSLAPLANHNGVLRVLRQPNVAVTV